MNEKEVCGGEGESLIYIYAIKKLLRTSFAPNNKPIYEQVSPKTISGPSAPDICRRNGSAMAFLNKPSDLLGGERSSKSPRHMVHISLPGT